MRVCFCPLTRIGKAFFSMLPVHLMPLFCWAGRVFCIPIARHGIGALPVLCLPCRVVIGILGTPCLVVFGNAGSVFRCPFAFCFTPALAAVAVQAIAHILVLAELSHRKNIPALCAALGVSRRRYHRCLRLSFLRYHPENLDSPFGCGLSPDQVIRPEAAGYAPAAGRD